MKGLLIKDFRLLAMQRRYFLMMGFIAVFMAATYDDLSFMVGFVVFLLGQFAVSTISYDEFDNGYAFLFTLPVSRGMYAASKYLFGLLLTLSAWLAATPLAMIAAKIMGQSHLAEAAWGSFLVVPVVLVSQALLIPLQLKFGGEKGRLVLLGIAGGIVALVFAGDKLLQAMDVNLAGLMEGASQMDMGLAAAGALAAALAAGTVSFCISLAIMKKKEF